MPLWPPHHVHDGDLVLLDVHVIRRKCDHTGRFRRSGPWDYYRVERELRAVLMIRPRDGEITMADDFNLY